MVKDIPLLKSLLERGAYVEFDLLGEFAMLRKRVTAAPRGGGHPAADQDGLPGANPSLTGRGPKDLSQVLRWDGVFFCFGTVRPTFAEAWRHPGADPDSGRRESAEGANV